MHHFYNITKCNGTLHTPKIIMGCHLALTILSLAGRRDDYVLVVSELFVGDKCLSGLSYGFPGLLQE